MFGERAITAGEGRASFGFNYIHSTYDAFDGVSISDGSLQTVTLRTGATPRATGTAQLTISTDTFVLFTNVALNRWFDARSGGAVREPAHRGHASDRAISSPRAARPPRVIGDIALRSKIRLYRAGSDRRALWASTCGSRPAILRRCSAPVCRERSSAASGRRRSVALAPHASFGFEYWGKAFQVYDPLLQAPIDAGRHGVAYEGGVEWAAGDRLTVNGELIGRTINDGGRLAYRDLPMLPNPFGITSASVATVDPRGLHRVSVAAGIKWNFTGTALLTANLLVPVNDQGLRDHLTPVIGLDWGF